MEIHPVVIFLLAMVLTNKLFWAHAGMMHYFQTEFVFFFFVAEKDICVGRKHSFSLLCCLSLNSFLSCCDVAELEGCGLGGRVMPLML